MSKLENKTELLDERQRPEVQKMISDALVVYDTSASFQRSITDTPHDAYSIVNRRYVTLNGGVASRPRSSVATIGQPYFATDTAIPMTFDGNNWRNGVGSVVAAGRN